MADSFVQHVASGSTDTFSIPFGYLDPTHVSVKVDSVTEAFTFPTTSQVQITSGNPAASAIVEVRRTTPRTTREVVWQNAANLTASDLNTSDLQFLYITQEAFDEVENALKLNSSNVYDAGSRRITNVATPTASSDAATKGYLDTLGVSELSQAVAARDKAEEWAEKAEDSEVETGQFSAKHHALKAAASVSALPTNNFAATTAPTVGDDSGDGYSVGSRWVDTTADESYICTDASLGAAVWLNSTLTIDELGSMALQNLVNFYTKTETDTAIATGIVKPAYEFTTVSTEDTTARTAGTYSDVTGHTVTITCNGGATSKVELIFSIAVRQDGSDDADSSCRIMRSIDGGSFTDITGALVLTEDDDQGGQAVVTTIVFPDEPMTSDEIVYKLQCTNTVSSSLPTFQPENRSSTVIAREVLV